MITAAEANRRTVAVTPVGWPTDPAELEEVVYNHAMAACDAHVQARSRKGRSTAWMEPFQSIPGGCHKPPVEDAVMARVVTALKQCGYRNVVWDRRDKRVVLRFSWAAPK